MRHIKENGTFAEQVSVPILPSSSFPCKVQKRRETICNDLKRCDTEGNGISA
jgi:hypothetical protein